MISSEKNCVNFAVSHSGPTNERTNYNTSFFPVFVFGCFTSSLSTVHSQLNNIMYRLITVSYTHLDVYKRQL